MNVKRFTARTSRDALKEVRHVFGDDAVVVSTRPCPEGVEVLAMPAEAVEQFEKVLVREQPTPRPSFFARLRDSMGDRDAARATRQEPTPDFAPGAPQDGSDASTVEQDVQRLGMSTLSFQEYVRERMLRRRKAQLAGEPDPLNAPDLALSAAALTAQRIEPKGLEPMIRRAEARNESKAGSGLAAKALDRPFQKPSEKLSEMPSEKPSERSPAAPSPRAQGAHSPHATLPARAADGQALASLQRERADMVTELRSMKGLIEQRFGALAFMEKMQREPRQAQLTQRLLDAGFSPGLIRKLVASLPADVEESAWTASVLERNLQTSQRESSLEDQGGIFALVGPTGVGKTTATAKLAAAFAARHGAADLGLITLDAYRMGAQEQLRAYGRILGVTVHSAHDRHSLEDLLDLLSGKKMVLIDTAGMAQRDARNAEILEMLAHPSLQRLLVINAAAQGETIEDVVQAYRSAQCRGVVLSKLDEAVKLGPALDALIRHRLKVLAVSNGQRVPEDWHRLSAATLVQRALRVSSQGAWRLDGDDVNLVFASHPTVSRAAGPAPLSA